MIRRDRIVILIMMIEMYNYQGDNSKCDGDMYKTIETTKPNR